MPYIAFPAIHCPDLEHLSHADVISNGTAFESTAEIICHDGYRLDDGTSSTTVSCQSNATWNHQNVFCEGKHDPLRCLQGSYCLAKELVRCKN